MKAIYYILTLSLLFSLSACKHQNHIDKYGLKVESLIKLPDNFYAYRRGRIFIDDHENLIWFNLGKFGNIENIERISTKNSSINHNKLYTKKDSADFKINAQEFINLSKKYKFGHINIDRKNKISFSYIDGLSEQFVKTLNDSMKMAYLESKDFKLLDNGWFENRNK